jgi:hypothetical protein
LPFIAELPSFEAPVKAIMSTNALPLGTRNRFAAAAAKEMPASVSNDSATSKPDPPVAALQATPSVAEGREGASRAEPAQTASKPALKVHPDRLKAVIDPQNDFAEPGKLPFF